MVSVETSSRWVKLQSILALIVLIFSIFLFPTNSFFYLTKLQSGLTISSLCLLMLLISLLNRQTYAPTLIDVCLIFNILYTTLSVFWASNVHYVLYGLCTSIFTYAAFILFKNQMNNPFFKKTAYCIIIMTLMYSIGLEYLIIYSDDLPFLSLSTTSIIHNINTLTHHNFNYIGGLITILFPFLLIPNFKYHIPIKILISISSLFIIYKSNSAFVFIVLLGFVLYYVASFLLTKKQLIISSVGILILGVFLIGFQGKQNRKYSYIIGEFFSQNDRIQMSKNNLTYFTEHPILGCGRNNWSTTVSQYGYNDFVYNRVKITYFKRFTHAHNLFFEKLSELGLIGLLPYFIIMFSLFKYNIFNQQKWTSFERCAFFSLSIFIILSMMYGVVYNHANNIRLLTIFSIFILAILAKNHSRLTLFNRYLSNGILIGVIIGLGFSMYFFFTTTQNENTIKLAQHHIRKKAYKKARLTLNKLTNISPRADVLFLKGSVAEAQSDYEKAIDFYYEAIHIDPNNINFLLPYGKMLYDIELYEDALAISEYIGKLQSNYVPNNVLMVKALFQVGKVEKSKNFAIKLNENLEEMITNNKRAKSRNSGSIKILKQLEKNLKNLNEFNHQNFQE